MRKRCCVLLYLFVLVLSLSSCSSKANSIAGTYTMSPGFYNISGTNELILAKDGTAKVTDRTGERSWFFNWSFENDKLYFSNLFSITVSADIEIDNKFSTMKINYGSLTGTEFILERTGSAPKSVPNEDPDKNDPPFGLPNSSNPSSSIN